MKKQINLTPDEWGTIAYALQFTIDSRPDSAFVENRRRVLKKIEEAPYA